MRIQKKNKVTGSLEPEVLVEEVVEPSIEVTPYATALDFIVQAIDDLATYEDDQLAKDAIADLGVVALLLSSNR